MKKAADPGKIHRKPEVQLIILTGRFYYTAERQSMTREEARLEILERSAEYFRKAKAKGYICPICGSGSGKNGTGITTKDGGKHFTCWAGCFTNADIFEIIGKERGLDNFADQLQSAADAFGIRIDGNRPPAARAKAAAPRREAPAEEAREETPEDLEAFFAEAHRHISETDYPARRGLSAEILDRFNIGYIAAWADKENAPKTPRLIIPTGPASYFARDTREEVPESQKGFTKQKHGKAQLFNISALVTSTRPVFVVEGEIDALSVIEAGGEAVALGSTAMARAFAEYCKKAKPLQPVILALDQDEAGEKAKERILEELASSGINLYAANISGQYKDPNEALQKNRAALELAIKTAEKLAREDRGKALEQITAAQAVRGLRDRWQSGIAPTIISTGFPAIDEAINDGFRAGLYVLGAVSSLGKTSLALQIADLIAQAGTPVLFVSLEMAREELVAKIISRRTYEKSKQALGTFNLAQTTIRVLNTHNYKAYDPEAREVLQGAFDQTEDAGRNLYILEGVGEISVENIREYVREIAAARGVRPVVFVDYLQILTPREGFRGTDKQAADIAVRELKRLSRDEDTPVIAISSFNRESYTEPVGLTSFKESGGIEFGADVVLGLQYAGMDYESGEGSVTGTGEASRKRRERINILLEKAKADRARGGAISLELKILKNRNGKLATVPLSFVPMFNCYLPRAEEVVPARITI